MGLFEDAAARIPGLVRAIFRTASDDDRNEITQLVSTKLIAKLNTQFLWSVISTTGFDYFNQKVIKPAPPPPPPTAPAKRPPLAVLKERLRLVYSNPDTEPYKALAFGYHFHLKYDQQAIALNLAAVTLDDLARSLIEQCAAASEIPVEQLKGCFARVLSLSGTPAGAITFQHYLNPGQLIQEWIKKVEKTVKGEPYPQGREWPDISGAAAEPPNRRLAFALGSPLGLGYRPPKIVSGFGHLALENVQTEFEALYRQETTKKVPLTEWKPVVLVTGDPALRQLMSYYTPSRTVGSWIDTVKDKLNSAELQQEKLGLATMLKFGSYTAEQLIAAFYTSSGFLAFPTSSLPRDFATKTVLEMEQDIEKKYASAWDFEEIAVARWFKPLRKELEATGKGNEPVAQYFPNNLSVSAARQQVLGAVRPLFSGGAMLPLFGWRHDLL